MLMGSVDAALHALDRIPEKNTIALLTHIRAMAVCDLKTAMKALEVAKEMKKDQTNEH